MLWGGVKMMFMKIRKTISSLTGRVPNLCQPLFFVPKSWHRFFVNFGSILQNPCQTCANPWHRFFVPKIKGRAKRVPSVSTITEETCANANPYIGVALGIGFVSRCFLTRKNNNFFSLIRRCEYYLIGGWKISLISIYIIGYG